MFGNDDVDQDVVYQCNICGVIVDVYPAGAGISGSEWVQTLDLMDEHQKIHQGSVLE